MEKMLQKQIRNVANTFFLHNRTFYLFLYRQREDVAIMYASKVRDSKCSNTP